MDEREGVWCTAKDSEWDWGSAGRGGDAAGERGREGEGARTGAETRECGEDCGEEVSGGGVMGTDAGRGWMEAEATGAKRGGCDVLR